MARLSVFSVREFHGKCYHDKHTLTDYLLFAIDTSERVAKPPEEPLH
jgi:hypothetical protein